MIQKIVEALFIGLIAMGIAAVGGPEIKQATNYSPCTGFECGSLK
jgi:hypothetical protein